MKKTYIVPSVKVAEVEIESIICQSVKGEFNGDLTVGSRRERSNDWDEDEDW